jgi:cysteine-S-conjugate beta-lyase
MKEDTKITHAGRHPRDHFGTVNTPVYRASTILFETVEEYKKPKGPRDKRYGRRGTPTHFSFEDVVSELEGAHGATITPSGLNAIAVAVLAFVGQGDHMLMIDTAYGPARRLANTYLKKIGVETTFFDPMIGPEIAGLMQPNTRIVYVEAPGTQTFEMPDIPAIAAVAHARGATVLMDNTWASPLFFKPFSHGVDVSIHAATKYIVGHSDAMLGVVTCNKSTFDQVRDVSDTLGVYAGPDEVYLGNRGIRTIAVRMRQHEVNALKVARWLVDRPEVKRVLYPALPQDPGHAIWKRDFLGASGLFGLVLNPASDAGIAAMLDGLEFFGMGASWGGFESLITWTHPEENRTATTWSPGGPTLRLHIGLEDPDDLIADLEAGFQRLRAER